MKRFIAALFYMSQKQNHTSFSYLTCYSVKLPGELSRSSVAVNALKEYNRASDTIQHPEPSVELSTTHVHSRNASLFA